MTIAIDKLLAVRTIASHADCPAGVASALLVHDVLPDADVRFVVNAVLVPDAEIANAPDLHQRLQSAVDRVNADLSVIERVRRFIIADAPFAIENEQLTPSLKIRRHVILKAYGDRLSALYGR